MPDGPNSQAPTDIPYVSHSRDALRHGISARVSSPTWDIESDGISEHIDEAHSTPSTPSFSHSTPRSAQIPIAHTTVSAPPSVLRARPIPRPAPSDTSSNVQDDYSFFICQPNVVQSPIGAPFAAHRTSPSAPRPTIVYVPETQPSQEPPNSPVLSTQSTHKEYIWVNSSQHGVASEAAIVTLEEESNDDSSEQSKHKFSTPENTLAFVAAYYNVNSFEFWKENMSHAYQTISEEVFHGALSPEQLQNGNKNLVLKYKVYEEVMGQTGMGTASEEVIQKYLDEQGHTICKARALLKFGKSQVYDLMHKVLQTDPSIAKIISPDPSRPLSPVNGYVGGDEEESDGCEVVVPASAHTPLRTQLATNVPGVRNSKPLTKPHSRPESVIDLDPTTDATVDRQPPPKLRSKNATSKKSSDGNPLVAAMGESMALMKNIVEASRSDQAELFKSQQAMQQAQMHASAIESKAQNKAIHREQVLSLIKINQSASDQQAQKLRGFQEERIVQMKEIAMLIEIESKGSNSPLVEMMHDRIKQTHEAIPWQNLAIQSAQFLGTSDNFLNSETALYNLFPNLKVGQVFGDRAQAEQASATEAPVPSLVTSPGDPVESSSAVPVEKDTEGDYGIAGPGPRTQANILASLDQSN
ncbi:hypothetical protein BN14_07789 [Rhizoctonia solani AG-1 IB]|uniref:Uncharacterized protein n=1 Tax=Thanatephorus cucumeris (strain AG1-IB / isolate 7/3/14) TaxID=1108050 RepID=M5C2Y3_THACB|nr:hypothetical protein BN14_07789 [Rhizoctonia solani AG-1 IB]